MTSDSAVGTTVSTGNRVLRNTYWLLGITLMFSALVAGFAAQMNMPALPWYLTLAGFFGLSYLTSRFENSGAGILCVFALTGFMGYTIGPLLNHYLSMAQGGQIVMTAFGGTAISFFEMTALSLAVSAMFVLLSSGVILWQTSQIVNGGETNYIRATVTLFVSIYNIFVSLLQLMGFASDD
jgi:modulator of FtsH protease